ncbi:RHS repeat domain-containing protein [Paenibacillus piscarius]|uniref:RHS repeat domain-containing protein n=1 Tax=Paenibacillus piscarius TaxID=1089681 RepID=UPI001EE96DAA|nr:RHS repeat-associated core domain-containing protein [Paenibacillus piscarius]
MGRKRAYYTVAGEHSAYILNQKDAVGRLTQINDYFLNFYTNYQYDKQRISKIQINGNQAIDSSSSANVVYNYFPNGLVQSITFPTLTDNTTLKTECTYNKALNWVESVTNKKGEQILSQFQYTYDNNGNIISITETKSDGTKQISNYSYDALNRIITSNRNGLSNKIIYTYDLKGNRKTIETSDEIEKEFTDSSHVYDLQNVLTSVTKGTSKTDYYYYADGLRFKKINGNNETQYNYNFNAEVISEEKNNGQQANYVRGDRVLVKKEKKDNHYLKDYYYLYNGHGDVIQIVDTSGTIVNSYSYDEWGNISNQIERISNPFKYTGEVYDEETGYYYLRARYYDPSVGRFLNEDTHEGQIDNPLSLNLYTYVHNNPLFYTDPTGHEALPKTVEQIIRDFKVITGGAASGAKKGSRTGIVGTVISVFMSALLAATPAGEDQQYINKKIAESLNMPILSVQQAEKFREDGSKNIVFRALSKYDVGNLVAGRGIVSKHTPPHREWSLLEHILDGNKKSEDGEDISMGFDPWIATTRDIQIALKRFNSGHGIVVIDLNKVQSIKKSAQYEFMGVYEPFGAEYAAEMAESDSEVSVYKYIPINAIVGLIP